MSPTDAQRSFVVVLDPGHGGVTPSDGSSPNRVVSATGLLEKDLVLAVARAAARELAARGISAHLTRDADVNPAISERAARSRELGADAFVSLHLNSTVDLELNGTLALVYDGAREQYRSLAAALVESVSGALGARSLGVRTTDVRVLRGEHHLPGCAVCLVELAHLSNPAFARAIGAVENVEGLGRAVALGISRYLAQPAHARGLAAVVGNGEQRFYEDVRERADPQNFPINLPEPGDSADVHQLRVPDGLRFARWEVEVERSSPGASYEVNSFPRRLEASALRPDSLSLARLRVGRRPRESAVDRGRFAGLGSLRPRSVCAGAPGAH